MSCLLVYICLIYVLLDYISPGNSKMQYIFTGKMFILENFQIMDGQELYYEYRTILKK